jgi:hypothetical protein
LGFETTDAVRSKYLLIFNRQVILPTDLFSEKSQPKSQQKIAICRDPGRLLILITIYNRQLDD